jgi:hypothetical protein
MCFGECLVQLEGPDRRLSSLLIRLFRTEDALITEEAVGLGDTGVGEGVAGIEGQGLLEVVDSFPRPLSFQLSDLIYEEASLEV